MSNNNPERSENRPASATALDDIQRDIDTVHDALTSLGTDLAQGLPPTVIGRRLLVQTDPTYWTDLDEDLEPAPAAPDESTNRVPFTVIYETDTGRWFVSNGTQQAYTEYPHRALEGLLVMALRDQDA